MLPMADLVTVEIAVTWSELVSTVKAIFPFGVIAIAVGSLPTLIVATTLSVAVAMTLTEFDSELATYTARPFGVMATASGWRCTLIVLMTVLVAVLITLTRRFATSAT